MKTPKIFSLTPRSLSAALLAGVACGFALAAGPVTVSQTIAPKTRSKTPNERHTRRMFFGCPVRKIHPDHIDPGSQNPLKDFRIGSGGTKGRDYFGRAMRCHW